jgi:hypothetical protein
VVIGTQKIASPSEKCYTTALMQISFLQIAAGYGP